MQVPDADCDAGVALGWGKDSNQRRQVARSEFSGNSQVANCSDGICERRPSKSGSLSTRPRNIPRLRQIAITYHLPSNLPGISQPPEAVKIS